MAILAFEKIERKTKHPGTDGFRGVVQLTHARVFCGHFRVFRFPRIPFRRYRAEKAINPRFSHRFIADSVGAASSGWFSDIVKGRISLTSVYRLKLFRLFDLKSREEDYLECLVDFGQSSSAEEKNKYLAKLLSFKEVKSELLGDIARTQYPTTSPKEPGIIYAPE